MPRADVRSLNRDEVAKPKRMKSRRRSPNNKSRRLRSKSRTQVPNRRNLRYSHEQRYKDSRGEGKERQKNRRGGWRRRPRNGTHDATRCTSTEEERELGRVRAKGASRTEDARSGRRMPNAEGMKKSSSKKRSL
ncbi:hypothetical protein H6P81_003160 [Aristolochia fimbriata]|uniref:Uncharacterized protein n=1 Tax=Aristolochia fimbriata TaxID=158543 RepID=A0AAV7FF26_ARIFI|nr:hypothetical protein H6P81_003160 [Aristolochia fimbriata]